MWTRTPSMWADVQTSLIFKFNSFPAAAAAAAPPPHWLKRSVQTSDRSSRFILSQLNSLRQPQSIDKNNRFLGSLMTQQHTTHQDNVSSFQIFLFFTIIFHFFFSIQLKKSSIVYTQLALSKVPNSVPVILRWTLNCFVCFFFFSLSWRHRSFPGTKQTTENKTNKKNTRINKSVCVYLSKHADKTLSITHLNCRAQES